MSEPGPAPTVPAMPQMCWPVDWGCVDKDVVDEMPPALKARSEALAVSVLRSLTAYQVGGCPVVLRPCAQGCANPGSWLAAPVLGGDSSALGAPVGPWWAHIDVTGQWVNTSCGCGVHGCSCTRVPEVVLPGPVGHVVRVMIDGAELDPSAYRVDDGNRLVRTDGEQWPRCQDMLAAPDQVGAFTVEYLNANPVDGLGAWVAGVLAYEFSLACTGGACRLPRGVTSIARQGVSMNIPTGAFDDGLTGIEEVDAWVRTWNPNRLKMPVTVWSPDVGSRARRTSWSKVMGP